MSSITIRKITPEDKQRLRMRAAENGRSMEEEARIILREALTAAPKRAVNLAEAIREHLAAHGVAGIDIPEVSREPMRDPPSLD